MVDWSDFRSYRCRFCREQCINRIGSEAERKDVCRHDVELVDDPEPVSLVGGRSA